MLQLRGPNFEQSVGCTQSGKAVAHLFCSPRGAAFDNARAPSPKHPCSVAATNC